jgi:hypothetical protein
VQAPQRRSTPARKQAAPSGLMGTRHLWPTAAGVVVIVVAAILASVLLSQGSSKPTADALTTPIPWAKLPGLQKGKPPWPNNSATLRARLPFLGLDALPQEALVYHIHAHLDVFVDGRRVAVPQYIGIHIGQSIQDSFITELHTHHSDGIVHVETAKHLNYLLGQFFGEWGIRLTTSCLGSFSGSCDSFHWYLDGKQQTGKNPAHLVLKNHEVIVLAVGKQPSSIPKSFDFAAHGV